MAFRCALLRSALLALVVGVAGCGSAPARPPSPPGQPACDATRLDACEQAIAAAVRSGTVSRGLVARYAAARAERDEDEQDAWASLWQELASPAAKPARGFQAAIVLENASEAIRRATSTLDAHTVSVATLPEPGKIGSNELLLAMGQAAGLVHLVRVRGPDGQTFEMFPNDPLGPFTAGLVPVLRDDRAATRLKEHLALGASIRRAFDAASRLEYVQAAREADRLSALIQAQDKLAEPVLRARYALDLLATAGITLEPQALPPVKGAAPAQAAAADFPPPAKTDSPYGDYLRVRLARDARAQWAARKAHVLGAIEPRRREAVDGLFRGSASCRSSTLPPPVASPRDLVFAGLLAGAIADLAPEKWLAQYTTLVRTIDESRTVWAHIPSLLYQRGAVPGISPSGTNTYRRVNEMALAHIAAVQKLLDTFPARYRALSQLPLLYIPGALSDDKLRDALIRLTQSTVAHKLAQARTPDDVVQGLLAGLFAGMSYPAAVQGSHFSALKDAFTAKLTGDLTHAAGWEVAGLYAADVAFRLVAGETSKPDFAAEQIARALRSDPSIAMPSLAALATSAARYAALALDNKLVSSGPLPPARRAARDALRTAIAGLGAPAQKPHTVPSQVLDDVTDLADRFIATLSLIMAQPTQAAPNACPGDVPPLDLEAKHALTRLGDLRKKILSHPRYRQGDGAWIRRVRLLVMLLSDGMDIAAQPGDRVRFTVPAERAQRIATEALRDWDEIETKDAMVGAYSLARGYLAARSAKAQSGRLDQRSAAPFLTQHAGHIRRVLSGLLAYFRADAKRNAAGKVALFDALNAVAPAVKEDKDLMATLLAYARALHERGHADQGDLLLLGSLVLSGVMEAPPPGDAIEMAAKRSLRLSWMLRFLREVWRVKHGSAPDPSAYEAGMRQAAEAECTHASTGEVTAVMGALRDYSEGRRTQARAALDRFLEKAERNGLFLPKASYRYQEKTATKIVTMSVDVSYGAGLLDSSSSFQVGFGLRSPGQPEGSLTATMIAADSAQSDQEAARYYVHAAALAAVYHFLQNDADHATAAAARAIDALVEGVRLGTRAIRSADPLAWGADARGLLAIGAQLAAESGQPLLAGDLWTVVRGGLDPGSNDDTIAAVLARPPIGLGAGPDPDQAKLLERTAKSLKRIAAALPCTRDRLPPGAFDEASCTAYPLALSLRVADALKKLPRLRKGEAARSPRCGTLSALDEFLAAADKRTYDPDLFMRAVEELAAAGRDYDAAVVLTRFRSQHHCTPAIRTLARALGRSPKLGLRLRSDLLSVAVNCAVPAVDEGMLGDLAALDEQTRRLADPAKSFRLLLFAAELGAKTGRWEPLGRLARPDVVDRWMQVSPGAATAALIVDHAAAILTGKPVALERTKNTHALLCVTFDPGDRGELCKLIASLRRPPKEKAERQKLARRALQQLVAWIDTSSPAKP